MLIKNEMPFCFYLKMDCLTFDSPLIVKFVKSICFSSFCKFSFTKQGILAFGLLVFYSDLFLFLIIFSEQLIYFTFPIDLNSAGCQVFRGDAVTVGENAREAAVVDFALAAGGAFFF